MRTVSSSDLHLALKTDAEIRLTQIQKISDSLLEKNKLSLFVKREDTCHSLISGNKWHKLRLNLLEAKNLGFTQVLSFGGAWSNHIHALAYACQKEGLKFIAVIRGEELKERALNPMLSDAKNFGARLHFISRSDYRKKEQESLLDNLQNCFGASYIIPEGGANLWGVRGSEIFGQNCLTEFVQLYGQYPSHIALACGSGTMTAGFIRALSKIKSVASIQLVAYTAAKDLSLREKVASLVLLEQLEGEEKSLPKAEEQWTLRDMSGRGFGLIDAEQNVFMEDFESKHNIPLEPVYTVKLFYQLFSDIRDDYYPVESHILVVHSGGLQGARSLKGVNV